MERVKIIVTLYYFARISCLKFNHVIIMKKFTIFLLNILVSTIKSKLKKPNERIFLFLKNSYNVMFKYICIKKINVVKYF
jgi:hypothetical protein